MSVNLPSHYTISFSNNIALLLQTQGQKLRGCVTEAPYVGKQAAVVDQIGQVDMQPVAGRFAPMGRVDATVDRRWVTPSDFDLPQQIDSFDKLRLVTEPESKYVQNAVVAAGRQIDRTILTATTATAKTGEQGGTNTVFNSNNTVTVSIGGTNSRLNVSKLLAVKEKMRAQFVDFDNDEIYMPLVAKDESALLNEIQIVSNEFNSPGDKPVMKDGKVMRFLGINFVYCELAETVMIPAGVTTRIDVPVWAKSGMHLGVWNDIQTSIDRRVDLQGIPWQSYVYLTIGSTRVEENKVYVIQSFRP
jgi:hypothetical protein